MQQHNLETVNATIWSGLSEKLDEHTRILKEIRDDIKELRQKDSHLERDIAVIQAALKVHEKSIGLVWKVFGSGVGIIAVALCAKIFEVI